MGSWLEHRAARPTASIAAWLPALWAVGSALWVPTARAYSSFGDYTRTIQEGGGGGRLFTGTPADGYGCDVCHRGAQGASLEVQGLPIDGYQPGQTYSVTLRWPETTPHVALMAEITNAAGAPAGITALTTYMSWEEGQRCEESGFPAADVCRNDATGGGCCRDLEPTRDACSFPSARSVLWVIDCGSRFARFDWTAPEASTGDVWFSTEMVTSNLQNDAVGDGVTSLRTRIRPAGATPVVASAVGDCRAAAGASREQLMPAALTLFLLVAARRWRRSRSRTDVPGRWRT